MATDAERNELLRYAEEYHQEAERWKARFWRARERAERAERERDALLEMAQKGIKVERALSGTTTDQAEVVTRDPGGYPREVRLRERTDTPDRETSTTTTGRGGDGR